MIRFGRGGVVRARRRLQSLLVLVTSVNECDHVLPNVIETARTLFSSLKVRDGKEGKVLLSEQEWNRRRGRSIRY